jgi:hypothetical protein
MLSASIKKAPKFERFEYFEGISLVFFFRFENTLWTQSFKDINGNPKWNDETQKEQQHPESHSGNQKEQNDTKNTHLLN